MAPRLRFVVYSDYLCPWCYNVDVRLKDLAARYADDVEYVYKSYLLRPHYKESRNLEKFRAYTQSWLRPAADADEAAEEGRAADDVGEEVPTRSWRQQVEEEGGWRVGRSVQTIVYFRDSNEARRRERMQCM